ncbi:VWA domain-containing protein [Bacillus sp. FJAT-49736]|uniref:VWA domain-containing protein n=1 Tax=Bacillus sp. FJAT-49736 TaxID=2833582 RepID=UPI001BC9028A|nr:VWA domain-containing protein [Bacillus sp. FJAT-49736]MBS4174795.1 VWA domain-containing protein [Bacillus sp. FJAT-49736]MBS4175548.1 VWA domain-containing protein [Bacillus sp. FJAT-49736]
MYKRISMIVCFVLLLMAGCSGTKDATKQKAGTIDKTPPSQKVHENKNEDTLATYSDFEKIKAYTIPKTLEDLMKMPPGLLSKDVPYEKETSQVWGNFDMGDYKDATVEKLKALTAETDDVETIFKGMLYYLGSNSYPQSIETLRDYKGGLYEPYLPDPNDIKTNSNHPSTPSKALILLDASSSMLLNVDGKQKMKIAKTAVGRFASTIGQQNEISLYVYGHKGTQADEDKILSCSSIEEVYPLQHYDAKRFSNAVEGIQAKGWTPLAGAIKTAREKTAAIDGSITLYIVSDGAETCGGDPVKEAKKFAEENNHRKVNIIGFDVDQKSESQLKKVAKAGNGEYIPANTSDDLDHSITKKWVPSIYDVMEKHNSLLKNWGRTWTNLTERSALADRILYASYNEKDRLSQAIDLMSSNNLLSNEKLEQLRKLVGDHQQNVVEEMKKLAQSKNEEEDRELAKIRKKVEEWGKRMEKLRKK